MRKGRHNSWDNKWVIIAVVVGIVAVAAIALVSFLGSGNTGLVPGGQTPVPSGGQTPASGTGTTFPTVKQTTPVVIPAVGLFVEVNYIGGFNGTYGIDNAVQKVRNSGDRLYTIDSATGNLTATFTKEDKSSHVITVGIWKDGRLLTSATNSSAFGTAGVTFRV
jgi:flagellar basal body-associated protein FliL